jgi:hypothetical protein
MFSSCGVWLDGKRKGLLVFLDKNILHQNFNSLSPCVYSTVYFTFPFP